MFRLLVIPISMLLAGIGWWKQASKDSIYNNVVVCHPLQDDMTAFAGDPGFQSLHPSPLPISANNLGTAITYPTADGTTAGAYLIKAKKPGSKWLFVFQEWWGLNDHIRQEADRYYQDLEESVNVLAIDMYDGKVTTDPKIAGQYMQGTNPERLETIVKGAYSYAGPQAKVANLGWCFGGSWSLRSAIIGGKQNIGSVIFYGMPVKDVEQLKKLQSDVLGLFANEQYISKEIIEQFAVDMKAAGKKLDYKIFDAVHGFANPSNPRYDAEKTRQAYAMALGYLKKRL